MRGESHNDEDEVSYAQDISSFYNKSKNCKTPSREQLADLFKAKEIKKSQSLDLRE